MPKSFTVALGMSGGVDSSLTAHLLLEQGYAVTGVFLECWRAPGCRTDQDRQDALQVALELNIPFQVLDFKQAYKNKVVEYFFQEYQAGRTPNPDVVCNKEIKFGLFYDWAMNNGFDHVATGHYAKVDHKQLLIPKDKWKDQTYFLYQLTKKHLTKILFPLANLTKKEVRGEAKKRHLHVAQKKDSVGICFIGDINVHHFLQERLGEKPGEVVDTTGHVIGEHHGLWFYTIGQRHGFTINPTSLIKRSDGSIIERTNLPPFYVIGKNPEKNQLIAGFGQDAEQRDFPITDLHWVSGRRPRNKQLLVRIRHTGKLLPGRLKNNQVILDEPAKGVAAGQSAVFYRSTPDGIVCLGGGIISRQ